MDLEKTIVSSEANAAESQTAENLAHKVQQDIELILAGLKAISSASLELVSVSKEQADSSTEISQTLHGMIERTRDMSQDSQNIGHQIGEVASASETVAQGSINLSNFAQTLDTQINRFRLRTQDEISKDKKLALK